MAEGKVTVWQGDEINLFQLLEDRRIESERRNEVSESYAAMYVRTNTV